MVVSFYLGFTVRGFHVWFWWMRCGIDLSLHHLNVVFSNFWLGLRTIPEFGAWIGFMLLGSLDLHAKDFLG